MKPRILRNLLASALTLSLIGAAFYFARFKEHTSVDNETSRLLPFDDRHTGNSSSVRDNVNATHRNWASISKDEIDHDLSSKDSNIRARALGDLLNTRYKRGEAIALLQNYLNHPDRDVRFQAAHELFMLGSNAGFMVMTSMLKPEGKWDDDSIHLANGAAKILYQYRQPIDPQLLLLAYQQTNSTELKKYIVLQQLPTAKELVSESLESNSSLITNATYAGILRMDDEETIAKLRKMTTLQADRRLTAHWALYRATGSMPDFSYVLTVAKQEVGLLPVTDDKGDWAGRDALNFLYIDVRPETTNALQEIVERAIKNENSLLFSSAISALFYLHHDYAYVDEKVLSFMRGEWSGKQFGVIWDIAAARPTSEIESLAKKLNAGAYETHFILRNGRPVENWIYQYVTVDIPADVLPPIRK